jgi:LPS sulfotransferase NodH
MDAINLCFIMGLNNMEKRFVIITKQRSGSNMLVSMLESHPEIKCYGELMRITPNWMRERGYRGALEVLDMVSNRYRDDKYRFNHAKQFIEEVYSLMPGYKKYGFKMHIGQNHRLLEELIMNASYQILILRRNNILAQYSSEKIAAITGQGNAEKGSEIIRAKIDFNAIDFKKYKNRMEQEYKWLYEIVNNFERSFFEIDYTELNNSKKITSMLEWMDVDDTVKLEPATEKRNSSNILKRFKNPNSVIEVLNEMGCPDWERESPS